MPKPGFQQKMIREHHNKQENQCVAHDEYAFTWMGLVLISVIVFIF
ncbi:hypothetical protein JXQ70_13790 [bacterium]|nr:hypothetical protein [bacterium]